MAGTFYPRFSGNTVQIFEGLALRRSITITNKIVQATISGEELTIVDDKGKVHVFRWVSGALIRRI